MSLKISMKRRVGLQKEKGIMRFHRTLLILGLALYRAMQDELGDRDDLADIIHKVLWNAISKTLINSV